MASKVTFVQKFSEKNSIKVVTHAGQWHADELCAIALLAVLNTGGVEVIRTFDPSPYMGLAHVWVLDIGRTHDRSKLNFDHHQDGDSPATNLLVLNELAQDYEGSYDPNDAFFVEVLEGLRPFFERVSDIDRGIAYGEMLPTEFNALIRSCSSVEQAMDMAYVVCQNLWDTTVRAVVDKDKFLSLPKVGDLARMQEDSNQLIGWKELALAEGRPFLVTPNSRGGWQVISADAETCPVPTMCGETFRHVSGFMAVYPIKEHALKAATYSERLVWYNQSEPAYEYDSYEVVPGNPNGVASYRIWANERGHHVAHSLMKRLGLKY